MAGAVDLKAIFFFFVIVVLQSAYAPITRAFSGDITFPVDLDDAARFEHPCECLFPGVDFQRTLSGIQGVVACSSPCCFASSSGWRQ